MSAPQVQKLEALLSRVQHNRKLPRAAAANVTAVGTPAPVPAPAPVRPVSVAGMPSPAASVAARPARDRTATPLEMAVEGELNRPSAAQPEPAARPRSVVQEPRRAPAVEQVAPRAAAPQPQPQQRQPAQPVQPAQPAQPNRIEAAPMAPPSKPIANVVSKHPSNEPASFGQLLSRSLRLRPR